METWSLILALMGAFGFGTLLSTIVDKILSYRLQKKKFQFEKLYTERAQIIKETYKKMMKMHRAFESLMAPLQLACELSQAEKMKKAANLGNDFIEYFDINRIYFDEILEEKINSFDQKMKDAWHKFRFATAEYFDKQDIKQWDKAWEVVKQEIPKIRKEIEKNFREEIGIK